MISKANFHDVKVVVFDLDDTLYSELDYVRSGLEYVAIGISEKFKIEHSLLQQLFSDSLNVSRSNIFDRVLDKIGKNNATLVKWCISLYRGHHPEITLYPSVLEILTKIAVNYPIYIVTDGNKMVQQQKLKALGLYHSKLITKVLITHRYGLRNAKPSPYCFSKISMMEKVRFQEVIYIADNPRKDFVGIKPLNFRTARILTGQHSQCYLGEAHEAEIILDNLENVLELLDEL